MKKTILIIFLSANILFISAQGAHDPPVNPVDPCGATKTVNYSESIGYKITQYNESKLYAIRDNILQKYPRGKKYLNDFIYFSKVDMDFTQMKLNTIKDLALLLPKIYSSYDKFMDKNSNSIVIDSQFKKDALSVLGVYKTLSNDSKYINLIDNLINDISFLENKKKSEVKIFLEEKN